MRSARGSRTARWGIAAGVITVIVAGVVISSKPPGQRTADETTVVSSLRPACDFPAFRPDRLPWADRVGQPDDMTRESDGSAQLKWVAPRPRPSEFAPTEVALVRRPHPVDLAPEAATGRARGHLVRAVLVGDERVGSIRMFWREANRDCESYELNVDRGISLEDALTLLPR
jgi:hypothetical protein